MTVYWLVEYFRKDIKVWHCWSWSVLKVGLNVFRAHAILS